MTYTTGHKPEVYYNYVGGEWTKSSSTERLESKNPATRELVAYAQNSTVRDVEQEIDSIVETFLQSDWGV